MPAKHPEVKVPHKEPFSISYGGDEPVTYTPENGVVSVNPEHVATFLSVVDGSSLVGDTAAKKE